jgi:hypothetical protein
MIRLSFAFSLLFAAAFIQTSKSACVENATAVYAFHQTITGTCQLYRDCLFVNISNAGQTGGAIYFEFSSGTDLMNFLTRCTFFQCSSISDEGGGGGIRSSGCSLSLFDCCGRACWTGNSGLGQFLYAELGTVVNLTNPSICFCPPPSEPANTTRGTVYLSTGMRMAFSRANVTGCRILIKPEFNDGVILWLSDDGSFADRCEYGTFVGNYGRTGAHTGERTNVTYGYCNFVNNTSRNNLLMQGPLSFTTLDRCVFTGNTRTEGPGASGIGYGGYAILFCVFDANVSGAISSSTGVTVTASPQTHSLWHLNTGLCPGFRTPTSIFTFSSLFHLTLLFCETEVFHPSLFFRGSADFQWNPQTHFTFSQSFPMTLTFDGMTAFPASPSFHRSANPWSTVCFSFFFSPPPSISLSFVGSSIRFSLLNLSAAPSLTNLTVIQTGVISGDRGSSASSLLLMILLPLFVVLMAFVIGFLIFFRIKRNSHRLLSDSDDSPPKTVDICSDEKSTVNTTLTVTLFDTTDSQLIDPARSFTETSWGLRL